MFIKESLKGAVLKKLVSAFNRAQLQLRRSDEFSLLFLCVHLLPNFLMTGGGASTVITRNGLLSDLIFPHRIVLYIMGFALADCVMFVFGLKMILGQIIIVI